MSALRIIILGLSLNCMLSTTGKGDDAKLLEPTLQWISSIETLAIETKLDLHFAGIQ